jgi:hypothetical protein
MDSAKLIADRKDVKNEERLIQQTEKLTFRTKFNYFSSIKRIISKEIKKLLNNKIKDN